MWLDDYMAYVEGTEPPLPYHRWVGISCVAAALQKRVYTHIGSSRHWANLYITLVGPSGARKSTAMTYGQKLLKAARIVTAPDSLSGWQAFIKIFGDQGRGAKVPGIGTITHHSYTVFAKELKVFLKADLDFIAALTDLFDAEETWEYYTIKHEMQSLSWAFLNFVGATAPDWIRTMLPMESIGGGYTSRNIYIYAARKHTTDPDPPRREELRKKLVVGLGRMLLLAGESTLSPAAMARYREWYLWQDAEIEAGRPPIVNPRFEAYCTRRALFIRKLMLIRAAAEERLVQEVKDFEWALGTLEEAEALMPEVFAGQGTSPLADLTYRVGKVILSEKVVTSEALLKRFAYDLDHISLRHIEDTLVHQGLVEVSVTASGRTKTYRSKV